jgi:hypothetical protein
MGVGVNRGVGVMGVLLLGLSLSMGCASTQMDSTWTDPSAQGADLNKMAVLYMTSDEGVRRMAEDAVASEMASEVEVVQVVPSYQALQGVDLNDLQQVKTTLSAKGYDGVMVMRLAGVTETPVAVDAYRSLDGYYGWAAPAAYGDDYLDEEVTVRMVSNLYDVEKNKLIWSGMSETFDPGSAKGLVQSVSKKVGQSLEKQGIIH